MILVIGNHVWTIASADIKEIALQVVMIVGPIVDVAAWYFIKEWIAAREKLAIARHLYGPTEKVPANKASL